VPNYARLWRYEIKPSVAIILAALLISATILYVNRETKPTYQSPTVEFTPTVPFWDDPEYQQDQLEQRVAELEQESSQPPTGGDSPDESACYALPDGGPGTSNVLRAVQDC
jgi:hypothetical protein